MVIMEIQELRIGNWLRYDDEMRQVGVLDRYGNISFERDGQSTMDGTKVDSMFVQPIELTPEILVAAGFRHTNSIYYVLDKNPNSEWQAKLYDDGAIRLTHIRINSSHVLGIYKYLHQLQNVFSAINTGEDLKIELPTTGKK